MISVDTLNASSPIKRPIISPSLCPLSKCPKIPPNRIPIFWQVIKVISHRIVTPLVSKHSQPQLQSVHLSPRHGTVWSLSDLSLIRCVLPGPGWPQRWPQCPALLDQWARPLAGTIPNLSRIFPLTFWKSLHLSIDLYSALCYNKTMERRLGHWAKTKKAATRKPASKLSSILLPQSSIL